MEVVEQQERATERAAMVALAGVAVLWRFWQEIGGGWGTAPESLTTAEISFGIVGASLGPIVTILHLFVFRTGRGDLEIWPWVLAANCAVWAGVPIRWPVSALAALVVIGLAIRGRQVRPVRRIDPPKVAAQRSEDS